MKRTIFLFGLPIVLFLIGGCSKSFLESETPMETDQVSVEEKNVQATEGHRSVRYELTGDFTGQMDIMFMTTDGFTPPDPIQGLTMPWETSFPVPADIYAIGGFVNGLYGDAQSGEHGYLKLYLDDYLIQTVIRTSDEAGHITLPLETYFVEFDRSGTTIGESQIGKDVVYRVEGNYSGEIMLVYRVADGSLENILIDALPWEYTFVTTEDSYGASLYGLGTYGSGEGDASFEISVDGTRIDSHFVTSDEYGGIGLFPEIHYSFE